MLTDRPTDQQINGPTDGWAKPLVELREQKGIEKKVLQDKQIGNAVIGCTKMTSISKNDQQNDF